MSKNNQVEIINYEMPQSDVIQAVEDLKTRKNCSIKIISQQELLEKYENWNWIKHNQDDLNFYQKYLENSQSIEIYYNHEMAEKEFGDRFWFDIGYRIDEKKILKDLPTCKYFVFPKLGSKYCIEKRGYWIDDRLHAQNSLIKLLTTNQGFNNLDSHFKIVWSYVNSKHFYFSDTPIIWARNNICSIGSNSQLEILYLFSILNTKISKKVININLKSEHEKDLAISLNSIKSYLRVPILNTPEKLELKQKLILKAQDLLKSENTKLDNLVDFDSYDILIPQKFDWWAVHDGNLFLTLNNHDYWFEIKNKANENVIYKALEDVYGEPVKIVENGIELSQLKKTVIFDKNRQNKIKKEMDEIVFELYNMIDFLDKI